MKKIFSLFVFILLINITLFAGSGTQSDPFTVAQAIAKTDGSSQTYWVKGYIVGEMSDFSNNKYFYELAPPFGGTSAYLIADNPNEINLTKCMPIQLGTERAALMNLDEFPQYWRKEVLTCGLLRDYFSMPGLKTLSSLEITSAQPLTNETLNWKFYENMDGNYVAASSTSIFAGGTYTGDSGIWKLYGATWGDSGNDNKWGKAAARLRLSEASTGNPGFMQMEFDKTNGIGVVRFWAGYYSTDNGGALSLYISKNQGQTWENVVTSQVIAKDWKEYEFTINQIGNVRLRIMKAETGSAGINVDNIRVSDFLGFSDVLSPKKLNFSYKQVAGGVRLLLTESINEVKIYTISGQLLESNSPAQGEYFQPMQKGAYILKVNQQSCKLICE